MFDRRQVLGLGAGALAVGCAPAPNVGSRRDRFGLRPLDLDPRRTMRITVCTRPVRPAGPRIEVEAFGDTRVIHNYGHGGAGWSLSWGCAVQASALALENRPQSVAVIGAGAIGLTTALRLAQSGTSVTIYAAELPPETRSARATGVWSPASRIALAPSVEAGFAERWEGWARESYRTHQHFVGLAERAVTFSPYFYVPHEENGERPTPVYDFIHFRSALRDVVAPGEWLEDADNPFRPHRARVFEQMVFNVAAYSDRLTKDFLALGGRLVRRAFRDIPSVLALSEPVIVNCAGYGARSLWGDESLVPVRGQIGWLSPQPGSNYGVHHRSVTALSRGDGLLVQYTGLNDDFGMNDASETPDRAEYERALAAITPLFEEWR